MNEVTWVDWAIAVALIAACMWGIWWTWLREADEFSMAKRREHALAILEQQYQQDRKMRTDVEAPEWVPDPKIGDSHEREPG